MKKLVGVLCVLALAALPVGLVSELLRSAGLRPLGAPFGAPSPDDVGRAGVGQTGVGRVGARERYRAALAADASVAAAAHDAWSRDAEAALAAPLPLALPYAERVTLDGRGVDGATAAAFEVTLAPPEVLRIASVAGAGAVGGLLVDVLQRRGADDAAVDGSAGHELPPVDGAEPVGSTVVAGTGVEAGTAVALAAFGPAPVEVRWTPPVAGRYTVRVQPLIGSVGAFGFALERRAPLDFPVLTDAADPVRSRFGAARDGGRRAHHGIDVFAARGTPVLAAADGLVVRVGDSGRGGLHVWQRAVDGAGQSLGALYYAHLDSVEVLAGTRLARGERLGTVGNTGNARTTPPHLHFGLYRRPFGPTDPLPLVGERRVAPIEPSAGHSLPAWLTVRSPALNLRSGPGTGHAVVARLDGGALVRVLGVSGDWARVRATAADGARATGFVARALLGRVDGVPERLEAAAELGASPERGAPLLATLEAGETVDVSGVFDGYRRVETASGLSGWLRPVPPDGEGDGDAALPDG